MKDLEILLEFWKHKSIKSYLNYIILNISQSAEDYILAKRQLRKIKKLIKK